MKVFVAAESMGAGPDYAWTRAVLWSATSISTSPPIPASCGKPCVTVDG